MSVVTTVIVSVGGEGREVRALLGQPLDGLNGLRPLTGTALREAGATHYLDAWGGPKDPALDLWGGAFNYLNWDVLIRLIENMPWEEPGEVQVVISSEASAQFGLFELKDRRLAPVNVEAARQLASMRTEQLYADEREEPIRHPYGPPPADEEELAALVDRIAESLVPPTREELRRQVAFLTDFHD